MYRLTFTGKFKRSYKLCKKRGLDTNLLDKALRLLQATGTLPPEYKAHKLVSNYEGCWECHIKPNWLLIWEQNDMELTMIMIDTGTHSDLFLYIIIVYPRKMT